MEKILEVNNISGGYGSIQILNGIDLTVYESEFVTIIGPNGCGKSTFIKVIFGIANLYQGDIIYRNEDISVRSYCLFHQVEGLYVDKKISFAIYF